MYDVDGNGSIEFAEMRRVVGAVYEMLGTDESTTGKAQVRRKQGVRTCGVVVMATGGAQELAHFRLKIMYVLLDRYVCLSVRYVFLPERNACLPARHMYLVKRNQLCTFLCHKNCDYIILCCQNCDYALFFVAKITNMNF